LFIVAVKTDTKAEPPFKGIQFSFVWKTARRDLKKGRNLRQNGVSQPGYGGVELCRLPCPRANLLGKEGQGFSFLMKKLQGERLIASVMAQSHGRGDAADDD